MKIFLLLFYAGVASIFLLNWANDPSRLRLGSTGNLQLELKEKNPDGCALDASMYSWSMGLNFKTWVLNQVEEPVTISVGTSRVHGLRREDIVGGKFVNYAIPVTSIEDYGRLADYVEAHPRIKFILLGMDLYQFRRTGFRISEIFTQFPNAWLTKWASAVVAWSNGLEHRSVYFDKAEMWFRTFREYLSFSATANTWQKLRKGERLGFRLHRINLPANSAYPARCVLSGDGVLSRTGAVSVQDASIYTPEEMMGEEILTDMTEFDLKELSNPKSHWPIYYSFNNLSEFRLAYVTRFLERMRKAGVIVVGFEPPFPAAIHEGFRRIQVDGTIRQAEERLQSIFAQSGFRFVPLTMGQNIQCPQTTGFTDAFHPWRKCMREVVKELKKAESRLPIAHR